MEAMAYEVIRRYYEPESKLYEILVRHSEAVRAKALEIAKRHPEMRIDAEFAAEAALLHDIGIVHTDAAGIECHGTEPYIRHGILGAEMLRREGFPRHARVCERHTGSGLTAEEIAARNLPLPHQDFLPETVEERLICYADKFFSKTRIGNEESIERIRSKMARFGRDSLARFETLHAEFGL